MKKILIVILLGLSLSVNAGTVLDSEATDYEFDDKGCVGENAKHCLIVESTFQPTVVTTIPILFNPRLHRGYYQFDMNWYWPHTGIRHFGPTK